MTDHRVAVEPISCEEAVLAVWEYLDDEIDLESRDRIREHLDTCDHCLGQYTFEGEFLRAVSRALTDDRDLSSLRARVEQAMVEASRTYGRDRR